MSPRPSEKVQRRVGIFRHHDEILMIALGVLFVGLAGVELLGALKLPFAAGSKQIKIFGDIILLNFTHVGLTLTLLIAFPEFRQWRSANDRTIRAVPSRAILVFLLSGASILTLSLNKRNDFISPPLLSFWLHEIGKALIGFVVSFHALWQIRGLAVMYNENNQLTPWPHEKKLFIAMLFLQFAAHLTTTPPWLEWQASLSATLPGIAHFDVSTWLVGLTALTCVILVGRSLYQLLLLRRCGKYNYKPLFLLRLFLWPLSFYSDFAGLGLAACHGTEYLFFFRHLQRNTTATPVRLASIRWLAIAICLALIIFTLPLYFLEMSATLKSVLGSAATAIAFAHYYLDRHMFRMRNTNTRVLIGPLLTKTSLSQTN